MGDKAAEERTVCRVCSGTDCVFVLPNGGSVVEGPLVVEAPAAPRCFTVDLGCHLGSAVGGRLASSLECVRGACPACACGGLILAGVGLNFFFPNSLLYPMLASLTPPFERWGAMPSLGLTMWPPGDLVIAHGWAWLHNVKLAPLGMLHRCLHQLYTLVSSGALAVGDRAVVRCFTADGQSPLGPAEGGEGEALLGAEDALFATAVCSTHAQ